MKMAFRCTCTPLSDVHAPISTDPDVAHYQKIVVALNETIRIMAKIDEVIEAHGGWPVVAEDGE